MRSLRRLARDARHLCAAPPPRERCELCNAPVSDAHSHLVDLESRRLCCACRACALLFVDPSPLHTPYRTIPDRVLTTSEPTVMASDWARLSIPVALSFIFYNSRLRRWVAVYPSPAGAVESEPENDTVDALRGHTPLLDLVEPDVEALLARGHRGRARVDTLLVPVSAGYELVAHVRQRWVGFDGGDLAHRAIDEFVAGLRARSRVVPLSPPEPGVPS